MPDQFLRKASQRGSSFILDMSFDMVYRLANVVLLDASLYLLPRLSHALQPPRLNQPRAKYRQPAVGSDDGRGARPTSGIPIAACTNNPQTLVSKSHQL
jgi:hypothetical protein